MRLIAALGGNALLRRGERADHEVQRRNVRDAVAALAPLARAHQVVVVHGNGPQVGLLALESAADTSLAAPYPLDVLVAETQGMIGYWLADGLSAALPGREVVALVTRTVVDPVDPAFAHPVKFIGPGYDRGQAERFAGQGWLLRREGRRWRRVVPAPDPLAVVETPAIAGLLSAGAVVIACGGGGVPVTAAGSAVRGVEAVVDKDLTAALLASELNADALLLLTDVDGVQRGFGGARARTLREATVPELVALGLPEGSMAPKVEACRRFLAHGGRLAAIGDMRAAAVLAGRAGTRVLLGAGA